MSVDPESSSFIEEQPAREAASHRHEAILFETDASVRPGTYTALCQWGRSASAIPDRLNQY